MNRLYWPLLLIVAFAMAGGGSPAEAQMGRSYRPSRPTFSPWFDLFQENRGPLDNYHMFVRPQQELYETINRQETSLQQQRVQVGSLGQQVNQLENPPRAVRPTGAASTFMTYSHYFQNGRTARPGGSSRSRSPPPVRTSFGASGGGGRNF